ncbi:hypothetical protein GCM10028791_33770 [Echinicola sediminis]
MDNKSRKYQLIRERINILLVVFCCFVIANSHFFVSPQTSSIDKKELIQGDADGEEQEHQTFLDVATEAIVVPFASVVAQNTMQLIYEIVGFEEQFTRPQATMSRYPSHFLEVLLERIIAPNAP